MEHHRETRTVGRCPRVLDCVPDPQVRPRIGIDEAFLELDPPDGEPDACRRLRYPVDAPKAPVAARTDVARNSERAGPRPDLVLFFEQERSAADADHSP
jgi:hypothetical protein